MLVKSELTSRLPIKNSKSCATISSDVNESFTVYSLLVKDFKIGTRNFANLWVGVLIANKIGRKGRQLWMNFTKTIHYTWSSPNWFKRSRCFFQIYS